MREARYASLTGKAGEYAVAAQLALRQVHILWPAADDGFDLMTVAGCRIQVKCAHLCPNPRGARYHFPLPKMRRVPNSDKTTRLIPRKPLSEVCDFVVFWGIEQNKFWVVPASLVDSCTGFDIGFDSSLPRFVGSIKDMREMRSLGYSYRKIGGHYDLDPQSVRQFIDSGKDTVDETTTSRIRAGENAWGQIIEFVRLVSVTRTQEA